MYARNPFTGTLGRCIDEATRTVIVAAVKPLTMTFEGCGVETRVCETHAVELISDYKAIMSEPGYTPMPTMRPVADLLRDYAGYKDPPEYFVPKAVREELAYDQPDLAVDDGKTDENGVQVSYNAVPRRMTRDYRL
jgi:hypothetical protein